MVEIMRSGLCVEFDRGVVCGRKSAQQGFSASSAARVGKHPRGGQKSVLLLKVRVFPGGQSRLKSGCGSFFAGYLCPALFHACPVLFRRSVRPWFLPPVCPGSPPHHPHTTHPAPVVFPVHALTPCPYLFPVYACPAQHTTPAGCFSCVLISHHTPPPASTNGKPGGAIVLL